MWAEPSTKLKALAGLSCDPECGCWLLLSHLMSHTDPRGLELVFLT